MTSAACEATGKTSNITLWGVEVISYHSRYHGGGKHDKLANR